MLPPATPAIDMALILLVTAFILTPAPPVPDVAVVLYDIAFISVGNAFELLEVAFVLLDTALRPPAPEPQGWALYSWSP